MLPEPLASHPNASQFAPAQDDSLSSWESYGWAYKRLGPTIWYTPGGGRKVGLWREDGGLVVRELWSLKGQVYAREVYRGPNLDDACQAASAAVEGIVADGYKSHAKYNVGIQEWLGLGTIWDKPEFDPDRILDRFWQADQRQERRRQDAEERDAYAREQGLLDEPQPIARPQHPQHRSRTSPLAERAAV